jgi:hypothetical protein
MGSDRWIVVTTIQAPTPAIGVISDLCSAGWSAVVIGDTKTPRDWASPKITFLSVEDQLRTFGDFAARIPVRHYSRKNLGYLYALRNGAKLILETDDDNIPANSFGAALQQRVHGQSIAHEGWVNIYRHFTDRLIWPRGLSLAAIHSVPPLGPPGLFECPIQQYLADDDPDVDAIYRLLYKDPVQFGQLAPIVLRPGAWCPFNSQNTVFFGAAFPLLYLPCHVSFRMTDIWRSFVAQAVLWAHDFHLSFHSATVRQVRNDHNLMHDFRDEVPGYVNNDRIAELLASEWKKGPEATLSATAARFWRALATGGILSEEELPIIDAWFASCEGYA